MCLLRIFWRQLWYWEYNFRTSIGLICLCLPSTQSNQTKQQWGESLSSFHAYSNNAQFIRLSFCFTLYGISGYETYEQCTKASSPLSVHRGFGHQWFRPQQPPLPPHPIPAPVCESSSRGELRPRPSLLVPSLLSPSTSLSCQPPIRTPSHLHWSPPHQTHSSHPTHLRFPDNRFHPPLSVPIFHPQPPSPTWRTPPCSSSCSCPSPPPSGVGVGSGAPSPAPPTRWDTTGSSLLLRGG